MFSVIRSPTATTVIARSLWKTCASNASSTRSATVPHCRESTFTAMANWSRGISSSLSLSSFSSSSSLLPYRGRHNVRSMCTTTTMARGVPSSFLSSSSPLPTTTTSSSSLYTSPSLLPCSFRRHVRSICTATMKCPFKKWPSNEKRVYKGEEGFVLRSTPQMLHMFMVKEAEPKTVKKTSTSPTPPTSDGCTATMKCPFKECPFIGKLRFTVSGGSYKGKEAFLWRLTDKMAYLWMVEEQCFRRVMQTSIPHALRTSDGTRKKPSDGRTTTTTRHNHKKKQKTKTKTKKTSKAATFGCTATSFGATPLPPGCCMLQGQLCPYSGTESLEAASALGCGASFRTSRIPPVCCMSQRQLCPYSATISLIDTVRPYGCIAFPIWVVLCGGTHKGKLGKVVGLKDKTFIVELPSLCGQQRYLRPSSVPLPHPTTNA